MSLPPITASERLRHAVREARRKPSFEIIGFIVGVVASFVLTQPDSLEGRFIVGTVAGAIGYAAVLGVRFVANLWNAPLALLTEPWNAMEQAYVKATDKNKSLRAELDGERRARATDPRRDGILARLSNEERSALRQIAVEGTRIGLDFGDVACEKLVAKTPFIERGPKHNAETRYLLRPEWQESIFAWVHDLERREAEELGAKRAGERIAKLGAFMHDGRRIEALCMDESEGPPRTEAEQWSSRVEEFLEGELGPSYVPRFRNAAGLPLVVSPIESEAHARLWAGIQARLARLGEFLVELGPR